MCFCGRSEHTGTTPHHPATVPDKGGHHSCHAELRQYTRWAPSSSGGSSASRAVISGRSPFAQQRSRLPGWSRSPLKSLSCGWVGSSIPCALRGSAGCNESIPTNHDMMNGACPSPPQRHPGRSRVPLQRLSAQKERRKRTRPFHVNYVYVSLMTRVKSVT